ncbi:ATP/GTP-binding protein [Pseudomonadota bacterium]
MKNFFSFADKNEFSFQVPEHEKDSHLVSTAASGDKLNKVMLVVGANASGKTGLLKPLMFLYWFLLDSYSSEPSEEIFFEPHFFHEDEPSSIEIVFNNGEDLYTYSIEFTRKMVLKEELRIRNIGERRVTTKRVFKREWNDDQYEIFQRTGLGFPISRAARTRKNTSFFSIAIQEEIYEAISILSGLIPFTGNVGPFGNWDGNYLEKMEQVAEFYHENDDIFETAKKLLRELDLGIDNISIKQIENQSGKKTTLAWVQHTHEEKTAEMQILKESTGTQGLFCFFQHILPVLKMGGVVILDEIESDLHPYLSERLIDMFLHEETNPKNAQLILATHDVTLFNLVGKRQLMMVEKDESLSSYCYRLDEVQGVRSSDNLMMKYLGGNYGAVPRV